MQFNLNFNSSYFNFHAYHTIEIEQKKNEISILLHATSFVVPFLPLLRFINRSIQNGSLLLYTWILKIDSALGCASRVESMSQESEVEFPVSK